MLKLSRVVLAAAAALILDVQAAGTDAVDEASALLKRGEAAQALARVETHLKANPKEPRGRFLRGVILAEQNKPDEAIAAFRALTEEMPELPEPYNNLAVLYAARGRYDEARRVLETAIAAHPGYALAHENLGDVYVGMAAQSYARAGKLDPKSQGIRNKMKLVDQLLAK